MENILAMVSLDLIYTIRSETVLKRGMLQQHGGHAMNGPEHILFVYGQEVLVRLLW